ncbi:MAG: hypothetical protein ACF8MF_03440 [Phycisphaerales bacterium JB052]
MHAPTKPSPTFLPHPLFNPPANPFASPINSCASPVPTGEVPAQQAEGASFASPALAGEVSRERVTEGVPPDARSLMADGLSPSLPALIEDLLNPSITTAELCQLHNLTLDQLDHLLTSPEFENAHASFTRANATRRALLEDEAQTLAAARLTDLLRDRPETPAHAETVRKAATTLRKSTPNRLPRACGGGVCEADGGGSCLSPRPDESQINQRPGARTRGNAAQCGDQPSCPKTTPNTPTTTSPASNHPSPTNPPTQPVPPKPGTIKDTHTEGVPDMNTKAAAAIFTIAVGSGVIAAAWYMANDTQPQPRTPTPTPQPTQPEPAGLDLFSLPSTPSPAKVFFESASGTPIPAGSRNDIRGMIGMMASLIDRMDEFDVDGDGLLSDLEKLAMGMQLRKEFLAEHDLDGDGNMSGDEWRAFQKAMFEKSAQGQKLMAQFDLDADGLLNEEEQAAFDEHLRQQEEQRRAEDRARMDKDNDGQISDEERRAAQRLERDFWRNQMRTAETSFDYDGDGELNIEETGDAWEAWVEYQELDDFITRYDTDGDRNMGPTDYDAFLTDYERRSPDADINNDGKVNVADINAFRDLVIRSRGI